MVIIIMIFWFEKKNFFYLFNSYKNYKNLEIQLRDNS